MIKRLLITSLIFASTTAGAWTTFVDGTTLTAGQLNGNFNAVPRNNNASPTTNYMYFTSSGPSTLTLPLTGTLSTLAGSEALTNKSYNGITGLVLGNGVSAATAYAGTSCTNQFTRSLNASGVATCASVASTDVLASTGTGSFVFATSPTLVTPTLGVATATTINKVTITSPASGSTLTIADGKTLIASNSLTLSGTDSTIMTFPTTSATLARTDAGNTFTGHQTIEGVTSTGATGTGNFVFSTSPTLTTPTLGVATATSINKVAVTVPATSATLTLADGSTLATSGANSLTLTTSGSTNVTLPTSGTLVNSAVTTLSSLASIGTITTGVWNSSTKIGLAYGGTNADLSATGGTSQVLKQSSSGAAVTVGQLAASDLSNGTTGSSSVVLATSPTITTPTVAAIQNNVSINNQTLTADNQKDVAFFGDGSVAQSGAFNNYVRIFGGSSQAANLRFFQVPGGNGNILDTNGLNLGAGSSVIMKMQNGHVETTGTAPTVSSGAGDCGTSPSIAGNDNTGRVTVGSSTNGGFCTVTFAQSWSNQVICSVNNETTGILVRATNTSTSSFRITGVIVAGDKLTYQCTSYQ